MSVEKMKRLTVYTCLSDTDAVVKKLIHLRCVNVEAGEPENGQLCLERAGGDEARAKAEANVVQITEALKVLHKYTDKLKSLVAPRHEVKLSRFMETDYEEAWQIVRETLAMKTQEEESRIRRGELEQSVEALTPWVRYDLPLSEHESASTEIFLGWVPKTSDTPALRQAIEKANGVLEIVSRTEKESYCCVIVLKSDARKMTQLLNEHGFNRLTFKDTEGTAARAIRECEREILQCEKKIKAAEDRMAELAADVTKAEILLDVATTELRAAENKKKTLSDGQVSQLSGWMPASMAPKVSEALDKFSCCYEMEDPSPKEEPPVLLRNNGFASNFEWVVGMYSYPKYGRFDPTFIMSIFYFFIFGVMFADVGYGLLVVLGCFGGIALLKPKDSMKRFLSMFGYCGISSILFGAVFGGWFGDMPFAIMTNMLGMADAKQIYPFFNGLWFNPMDDPIRFLLVALGVGVIHIVTGMAVKFCILIKDGQWLDALCDILTRWILFAGIGLIFVDGTVGAVVTAVGALSIFLTAGRYKKGIVGKVIGGFLGLYGIIDYLSDVLSYSRILALGLASAVIAQVINLIGTMNSGFIGFIIMILVFLFGHALNLAINLLGTFVHTSRLQYLEFFGKFYEDGGVPFKPEMPGDLYSVIDE